MQSSLPSSGSSSELNRSFAKASDAKKKQECLIARKLREKALRRRVTYNMYDQDVLKSTPYIYFSFYSYFPLPKSETATLRLKIQKKWREMYVLGRVYIGPEGINAQMAIPRDSASAFMESLSELLPEDWAKRGCAAVKHTVEKDRRFGSHPDNWSLFNGLHVRVRNKIVADVLPTELDGSLDLTQTGRGLEPEEWHETLQNLKGNLDGMFLGYGVAGRCCMIYIHPRSYFLLRSKWLASVLMNKCGPPSVVSVPVFDFFPSSPLTPLGLIFIPS